MVWVRRPSSLSSSPQMAQLPASSGERCPQSSDSESSELPRACGEDPSLRRSMRPSRLEGVGRCLPEG